MVVWGGERSWGRIDGVLDGVVLLLLVFPFIYIPDISPIYPHFSTFIHEDICRILLTDASIGGRLTP